MTPVRCQTTLPSWRAFLSTEGGLWEGAGDQHGFKDWSSASRPRACACLGSACGRISIIHAECFRPPRSVPSSPAPCALPSRMRKSSIGASSLVGRAGGATKGRSPSLRCISFLAHRTAGDRGRRRLADAVAAARLVSAAGPRGVEVRTSRTEEEAERRSKLVTVADKRGMKMGGSSASSGGGQPRRSRRPRLSSPNPSRALR